MEERIPFGITEFPPNQNKPHPRCVGWSGRHGDYTRGLWKLGRVERLNINISVKDGIVRGAVVKSTTKQGRLTMLRRPLQKLYRVECGTRQEEVPLTHAPVAPSHGADARQRPRRAIACRADSNNRRLLIQNQAL